MSKKVAEGVRKYDAAVKWFAEKNKPVGERLAGPALEDAFNSPHFPDAPTMGEYGLAPTDYARYGEIGRRLEAIEATKPKSVEEVVFISGYVTTFCVGLLAYTSPNNYRTWKDVAGTVAVAALFSFFAFALLWGFFLEPLAAWVEKRRLATWRAEVEPRVERDTQARLALHRKIDAFETAYFEFFCGTAAEVHDTWLYRRRATSSGFGEALDDLEDCLQQYHNARCHFLSHQPRLEYYNSYLASRRYDFEQLPNQPPAPAPRDSGPVLVRPRTSDTRNAQQSNNARQRLRPNSDPAVEPPEERFRKPRKFDYSKMLEANKETGNRGEDIAVAFEQEHLASVGRQDLADRVRNIAKEDGDGAGYDILSFDKDGGEKYIEVKTTTGELKRPFYLTKNELRYLATHLSDSFIYRIALDDSTCLGTVVVYRAITVIESDPQPVSFSVRLNPDQGTAAEWVLRG